MYKKTRDKIAAIRFLIFFLFYSSSNLIASSMPPWLAFGDLRGHFESCGCNPKTDKGGVARLSTLIKRDKILYPELLILDLGNNYKTGKFIDERKNRFIHKALSFTQ